ncbi:unnamed protein product, partial [Mesorhabditis spiculigera]
MRNLVFILALALLGCAVGKLPLGCPKHSSWEFEVGCDTCAVRGPGATKPLGCAMKPRWRCQCDDGFARLSHEDGGDCMRADTCPPNDSLPDGSHED